MQLSGSNESRMCGEIMYSLENDRVLGYER